MRGRDVSFRSKLGQSVGWIAGAAGLVAVVVITALTSSADNALGAALLFVGLMAGGFLAIAVHELGHAIGAWLVGWRVWIFSVLGIVVRAGQPTRFDAKMMQDAGGYVFASPLTEMHDTRWRSIAVSAGGPLASLLTGPIFIAWLATLPREGWESATGAGLLGAVLAFGVASAWSAVWTLWPMRSRGGRPNDMGMMLDALLLKPPPADARGVAWAWGLFEFGVESSAWPHWMHESVARNAASPWAAPIAPLLAFAAALERGDETAARVAARSGQHEIGKLMRAFIAACFDSDAGAAEAQLAGLAIDSKAETLMLLHGVVTMRVQALRRDTQGAAHTRTSLEHMLARGLPHPFWERLLKRVA